MSRKIPAVHPAYVAADALDHPCPTCQADIGRPCTRTDDNGRTHYRHVPCVKRCQHPLYVEFADDQGEQAEIDFTEPRHPHEEG
ncbi:hypothetical protein A5731_04700 [Mycolicibacterium conceptionense]|uniref:DNA-binding phage zinc finger domain-containing protein n=1 Tax=Mycolicibacterium conceptionense TaxID=451644 RepID=A0A1A1WQ66_9MYCO|nr:MULTISPECIES: hypothetical protein [Mycolicibacterium]MCW1821426.1 hypothetical protein [Mycolicibacterium senegalense]OBB07555.1 hypothetical protein A5718_17070 [Mycolicibacterium conceptionense]OBF08581.1 hypothetical protein A5731_04700 [Mycolicibacterium conceptionense]OBF23893.1 hypothetical protein A5726_10450 [Mycolicibacterium conceptionense]OBF32055.1 hypothetical protein A5720_27625 [Mycolicibacterium conceptionense]